ncbi:MAG: glycosyltransferase [Solirubrobacteraceae bacterium]
MSDPREPMSVSVLSVLVGGATRTGGPPAFVGGSSLELTRLGGSMRILATDLALAPTGWWQVQRRVQATELHPTLLESDMHLFAARFPRRLAFSPSLYREAQRVVSRYDVVHIHNLWQFPQYAGYRAALKAGVPYIVSPHGALDPYLRMYGRARKRLMTGLWQGEMLDKAALIHVTTAEELELIRDIAPHVPRAIVPPGVYVHEFSVLPPREAFRTSHLKGFEGPVILFLGRVTYKKGVDALIRAFAHARSAADCRLAVVGPDDEGLLPGLQSLARELGIEQDVIFTGPLYGDDRLAALSGADIWALSSHTENFGIAVIEAMAAGLPVVISPAVNLASDITEAGAGLVAALEPDRFGQALAELAANAGLRTRLCKEGQKFAARYDWSAIAHRLMDMYRTASSAA